MTTLKCTFVLRKTTEKSIKRVWAIFFEHYVVLLENTPHQVPRAAAGLSTPLSGHRGPDQEPRAEGGRHLVGDLPQVRDYLDAGDSHHARQQYEPGKSSK